MLNDGEKQYSYDAANRLTGLSEEDVTYSYAYNGLGDRISQSIDGATETYQLDLNAGLTQVLSDGTNIYLYGNERIYQETGEAVSYFLSDALGSVRTVLSGDEILLAQDYMPYGEVLASAGLGASSYGYAGEWTDASGMQYLRARYFDPSVGRFVSRDSWGGDFNQPISYNKWMYGNSNPIMYRDPSGRISCYYSDDNACKIAVESLMIKAREIKSKVSIARIDPDDVPMLPVEGLAQLTDYAYEIFDFDKRGMMWGMTKVLVGIDPNDYKYFTLQPVADTFDLSWNEKGLSHKGEYFVGQKWLPFEGFGGDTSQPGDWNPDYFDGTANQAFHFWYSAASRYFDGSGKGIKGEILANLANNLHDPYILEPFCGEDLEYLLGKGPLLNAWANNTSGVSQEDYKLALEGIKFGRYLHSSNDLPIPPGDWIRKNLK